MARPPKFTPEQVAEALNKCDGLVFQAAKKLGCDHKTVQNYINRHDVCRLAREQKQGENLDEAEGQLMRAVRKGEAWAICFMLKTQGKARGYVERQEVKHEQTAQLQIVEEIVDGRPGDKPAPPPPDKN